MSQESPDILVKALHARHRVDDKKDMRSSQFVGERIPHAPDESFAIGARGSPKDDAIGGKRRPCVKQAERQHKHEKAIS